MINKYKSIVPSEMTTKELIAIVGELYTAKMWKLNEAVVSLSLSSGTLQGYRVPTTRYIDYINELNKR